ncbi:acyltransferase, partial [Chloroflexota bacterium]
MTNNKLPVNGQLLKPFVWLNNSRILAIFVVLLAHSADVVIVTNQIGTYNWWIGNVYDILGRWSVPVFVMVSGALLLNPSRKEDLNTFYRKRLSRILLPILFWSVFYILITIRFGEYWLGHSPSFSSILMDLAAGKPFFHLWFLYMILGLYLFTPFLRKIVENTTRKELRLFVILGFSAAMFNFAFTEIFSAVEQPNTFITLSLEYVPFFRVDILILDEGLVPKL